ncbi:MAG: SIMPL domain-containing protein [Alphaproteobacteria bacterium]|nr:SIMPL domain-containing protein [Alphaproteobacteria bacterium]
MESYKALSLPALLLGVCIALGPSSAGYFIYKGIVDAKDRERYVTVKGLVERLVKSDTAQWNLSFQITGDDLKVLEASYTSSAEKVKAFLFKQGFVESDFTQSPLSIVDNHARTWGNQLPPTRYTITGGYFIQSSKVEKVQEADRNLASLFREGVILQDARPTYSLSTFNALRSEILAEATKNARTMAEQFAKDSNSQVGSIRRANQGVISILDPQAGPTEDWNSGQASLTKKIRVVSTFDFFLH